MILTRQGYEIYLNEKKAILKRMEEGKAMNIIDVEEPMNWEMYKNLGELVSNEDPNMTERDVAKKMAADQTYYKTDKEITNMIAAAERYAYEMGLPDDKKLVIDREAVMLGTREGRKQYAKFWKEIGAYYKELTAAGFSGKESGKIISQTIFGSE